MLGSQVDFSHLKEGKNGCAIGNPLLFRRRPPETPSFSFWTALIANHAGATTCVKPVRYMKPTEVSQADLVCSQGHGANRFKSADTVEM